MPGIGYALFFPLFLVTATAISIYLYLTWRIERHLEKDHHEIWMSLGRPHLVLNNSIYTSKNLHRFLRSTDAMNLDDPALCIHVRHWRRLRIIVAVAFLLMMCALLTDLLQLG